MFGVSDQWKNVRQRNKVFILGKNVLSLTKIYNFLGAKPRKLLDIFNSNGK